MKKTVLVLTCFTFALLAGCGGSDEKVIDGGNAQITEGVQENQKDDVKQPETVKSNGYVFPVQDFEINIDADFSNYLQKLGEPVSYFETPSCAFDNLDKFYTYHGFEIDTYFSDGKDLILAVVLLDDTVSTKEGLCIGDKQDKVFETYGEPTEKTDNSAIYKKDNMKLVFIFKDGVVASIEYKSLVLDAQ